MYATWLTGNSFNVHTAIKNGSILQFFLILTPEMGFCDTNNFSWNLRVSQMAPGCQLEHFVMLKEAQTERDTILLQISYHGTQK